MTEPMLGRVLYSRLGTGLCAGSSSSSATGEALALHLLTQIRCLAPHMVPVSLQERSLSRVSAEHCWLPEPKPQK